VSGFDIIYALQDDDFDRSQQLHSVPVWLGRARALRLSEVLHVGTAIFLLSAIGLIHSELPAANWLIWAGAGVFLALLAYQHFIVRPDDLSRVNLAFFTTNGVASLVFGSCAVLDFLM
jgi:4-hydroxybenzoate polyprenyltransferase